MPETSSPDTKSSLSIIPPFSPPPLCVVDDRTIVKEKDSVIVVKKNGDKTHGELHKDGIHADYILLDTDHQSEPEKVLYEEIKMLSLPGFKKWLSLPSINEEQFIPIEQTIVDFKVIFTDGDKLVGKTLGYNIDSNGIYFFPTQKTGYFNYSFIPHSAIIRYQIGPKLGEQLIKNNYIDEKHIVPALEEQKEKKKQPIGKYLKAKALVTNNALEQALINQKDHPDIKLGELLLQEKLITEEQLKLALEEQKKNNNLLLGQILINQGRISSTELQQSMANKLGIPFVEISKLVIDPSVLLKVPEKIARQYNVMPIENLKDKIIVAIVDPLNWKALEAIRFVASSRIIPVMALEDDIKHAIQTHYTMETDYEDNEEEYEDEIIETSNNVIVKLINKLIIDAHDQKVSDIHIESNIGNVKTIIRFRKDGELYNYHSFSPKLRRAIVSRLKVMSNLDITERRRPQDGKINFGRYSKLKIELRVSVIPTIGNEEDVVIRLLSAGKPLSLEEMNLNKDNIECIKYVLNNPHGLFVVCGPTGSGKTTLLHSLLSYLNTTDKKIWTVEDPVEITQTGLRQVQVQADVLDFKTTLRSFLRADPDIIMVGEMRDVETSKMCIEASLTGHMVLSTLHTNSACETVVRLLEMGIDPFNFSDALLGIVAQRLIRKLCNECREARIIDKSSLDILLEEYMNQYLQAGVNEDQPERTKKILNAWEEQYSDQQGNLLSYESVGCTSCSNSGYIGRIGLQEMLMVSNALRLSIYRRDTARDILKDSMIEGMTTLKQDGINKVLQGYTNMKQVRKAC